MIANNNIYVLDIKLRYNLICSVNIHNNKSVISMNMVCCILYIKLTVDILFEKYNRLLRPNTRSWKKSNAY